MTVSILSAFSSEAFLKFSQGESEQPAQLVGSDPYSKYPLFIKRSNNLIFKPNSTVCFTPICLSGPVQFDLHNEISYLCDNNPYLSAGFIQTRKILNRANQENQLISTQFGFVKQESRTNYMLKLGDVNDTFLAGLKRDSRSRINKIMKQKDEFDFTLASTVSDLECFSELYDETAQRNNFSPSYKFGLQHWKVLLENESWNLYLLKHQNKLVAGCVVSTVPDGYDYTFMAHVPGTFDYSRAIVYFLYQYLSKNSNAYLSLGGGIAEGDSLARYKLSLGGQAVSFSRVKFVVNNRLSNRLSEKELFQLMEVKWPPQ